MSVDGGMRKVPSANDSYEMLQNLLLFNEQDHHYIGEQQTLLLPKWMYQQRQILNQADGSEGKVMRMGQQHPLATQQQNHQIQTAPLLASSPAPFLPHLFSPTSTQHRHRLNHYHHPLSTQSPSYPHSNFPQNQQQIHRSGSPKSSPSLSPLSTTSSLPPTEAGASSASGASVQGHGSGSSISAGIGQFSASSSFPSSTSSIEQQTFFAHNALPQQFALQQPQPQQQNQQHYQYHQQLSLGLQQQQQQQQQQQPPQLFAPQHSQQ
ncbi:hypothetical protein EDD21DRAFT_374173 [Dissophora ornata]|nr:hypothetical protein EDD21DRAFT_374173 [Dissophora ornata]